MLSSVFERINRFFERLKEIVMFTCFGLLMVAIGLFMAWESPDYVRLALLGTRTEGTFLRAHSTSKYEHGEFRNSNYEYEYKFEVGGQNYINRHSVWAFQAQGHNETDPFPVTYLASDPEVNRYGGARRLWWEILAWEVPGILVILLGFSCILLGFKPTPTVSSGPRPNSAIPQAKKPGPVDDYPF